jgi:hypothetical protein
MTRGRLPPVTASSKVRHGARERRAIPAAHSAPT